MQSTQLGVTGEGRVTLHFLTTGDVVLIITTGHVVLTIVAITI